jgi:hypothetical protein
MIKTEAISPCALKIVPSEKLREADFHGLVQQVNRTPGHTFPF